MRLPRLLALLCLLAPLSAHAGPWVPGRFHLYAQLRESALFADQRYDARGDLQPIRLVLDGSGATVESGYREALTDLFVELGLAARLSVLVDFHALSAIEQPIPGRGARSAVGPSDLWLGGKVLLFDDELAAALEAGLSLPTGSATSAVPLGQGDLSADVALLVGKLFDHPFVSGEVGLRLRSYATVADPHAPGQTMEVQYSHALRFAGTAGYRWPLGRRALESLAVSAKLEGSYSFQAPVEDGLGLLDPVAGTYLKLGAELAWAPLRWLTVTAGGHYFVLGRSMPALAELALGLGVSR